ncbi:RNase H domain-containing protein [Phthorimaea operculella]|nr:RNase H domain-containing protein [Phthorimaea operculella]
MAVLMALESNTMSSSLIYECHLALQTIATNNKVTLQWIKGHSGSLGNDAADELARRGSEVEVAGPTPYLPIPFNQIRTWIRHQTQTQHNARWASITTCRQSKDRHSHPKASYYKAIA